MMFELRFDSMFHQIEGDSAVLVAGDPERKHMRKVEQDGGVHYHVNVLSAMVRLQVFNSLWWRLCTTIYMGNIIILNTFTVIHLRFLEEKLRKCLFFAFFSFFCIFWTRLL